MTASLTAKSSISLEQLPTEELRHTIDDDVLCSSDILEVKLSQRLPRFGSETHEHGREMLGGGLI
jgi:hypothetical protein